MNAYEVGALSIALTELIKDLVAIPTKYSPLICIIISILLSVVGDPKNMVPAAIGGLIAGLTATGLYKTTTKLIKK